MYDGLADPADCREQAERADIVILVETTPAGPEALEADAAGTSAFRTRSAIRGTASSNTAIYSRFPLSRSSCSAVPRSSSGRPP